ncbi:MAG: CHAT domain-containing protein [Caldilineaceae bacterium]
MFGGYNRHEFLPHVIHISIARYHHQLPKPGEKLAFLVTIHEEGTGISWQQNVELSTAEEKFIADATQQLHLWSLNLALRPRDAEALVQQLGQKLYAAFIGAEGEKVLQAIAPTAILLDVDETILNLPWELMGSEAGPISQQTPFGRLVTTRQILRPSRDPIQEDSVVRVLAVANPTSDLAATEAGIAALKSLEGNHGAFSLQVTVLAQNDATRATFADLLADGSFDIIHFAGHAFLNPEEPGSSALRFADGDLTADGVLALPWKAPPYFVFNSACESGRASGGQRLVSGEQHGNGLAAAFLAMGVAGYAGYFWPVSDAGAGIFAKAFYQALFMRENVGLAFLEARQHAITELGSVADLTGYSAILFGDAASKHRRDLATAAD